MLILLSRLAHECALLPQFWHLSSDEDITPLPALAERAKMLRARNGEDAGREGEDLYSEWKGKLVGEQVHQLVPFYHLLART